MRFWLRHCPICSAVLVGPLHREVGIAPAPVPASKRGGEGGGGTWICSTCSGLME